MKNRISNKIVITYILLIFLPIFFTKLYLNLCSYFSFTFNKMYFFMPAILYIIYFFIGIIFGKITIYKEREHVYEKHYMIVNIIGAIISLLLIIFLNSYITVFTIKENFDPYQIWTICTSFLFITAFTNKKDVSFYIIFSIVTMVFPILINIIRKSMNPVTVQCNFFVHIVYFIVGVLFAAPYLRKEYLLDGTWRIRVSKIILGLVYLTLAVVFNGNIFNYSIFNLDYFFIWTLSSAFLLATSIEKSN